MIHALRIAFRSLRRRPGFSCLAIVTIALGAGANAAVSAVAYSVLLKPLPYAQPERVVAVWPARFMTQVDLRYLREHARGLARISAVAPGWTFSLTGPTSAEETGSATLQLPTVDATGVAKILAIGVGSDGLARAIHDRLMRAADGRIRTVV